MKILNGSRWLPILAFWFMWLSSALAQAEAPVILVFGDGLSAACGMPTPPGALLAEMRIPPNYGPRHTQKFQGRARVGGG